MAPIDDSTTIYDYLQRDSYDGYEYEDGKSPSSLSEMAFWYLIVFVFLLLTWLFIFFCLRILSLGNYCLLFYF